MKTPSNIAATTLALREVIQTAMPPTVQVTTLAPAVAEQFTATNEYLARLNLALLSIRVNPHLRQLSPRSVASSLELPPLAVDLVYLVTAYGAAGPAEPESAERLLETVLETLHNKPGLSATELHAALPGNVTCERVQILWADQSNSEMVSLFTSCQAQWRPALTYHLRVIPAFSS